MQLDLTSNHFDKFTQDLFSNFFLNFNRKDLDSLRLISKRFYLLWKLAFQNRSFCEMKPLRPTTCQNAIKLYCDMEMSVKVIRLFPSNPCSEIATLPPKFPNLTHFYLSGYPHPNNLPPIDVNLFTILQQFTRLQLLNLKNSQFVNKSGLNDESFPQLCKLTNLTALNLKYNANVSKTSFVHLSALGNLKILHLGSTLIDDDGLVHLKNLTRLEKLNLSRCCGIFGTEFESLASLTRLKNLNLRACMHLNSFSYSSLKIFSVLKKLDLSCTSIDEDGLKNLIDLNNLKEIKTNDCLMVGAGHWKTLRSNPSHTKPETHG